MGKQGRFGDRFRGRLRTERERRGWSQGDLAKMLSDKGIHGIYPTTIAKIEAGERAVRVDELAAIADLFEVSLDGLLGRNRRPEGDLTFTLQAYLETARSASVQLSAIEASLSAQSAELAAFEFDERDTIIAGCDWARDVLTKASAVLLATTRAKSLDLHNADTSIGTTSKGMNLSEISVIIHDPVPDDTSPITADEMKGGLEALGYHVKAVLVRQDYAPPYWLLHRECGHHVGPFSTRLDAVTARDVAIAPEVFEILGDEEFKEYLDVRAERRAARRA